MSSIRFARIALSAVLPFGALAFASTARAEPSIPAFGRAGSVVIDDLIGLRTSAPGYLGQLGYGPVLNAATAGSSGPGYAGIIGYGRYSSESSSPYNADVVSDSVWLAPALDVFVAPRISVGVSLGLAYQRQIAAPPTSDQPYVGYPSAVGLTLSAVPRIGYVWPIAPRFAIWSRLGVGYAYGRYEQRYPDGTTLGGVSSTWLAGLDVKLLYQVTRHVYVDVAPSLAVRHTSTEASGGATANLVVGMGGTVGMGVAL